MRIFINLEDNEEIRKVYIEEHEPLGNLKSIREEELKIPFSEQILEFEGKILELDRKKIKDFNIQQDDILVLSKKKENVTNSEDNNNNIQNLRFQLFNSNNNNLRMIHHKRERPVEETDSNSDFRNQNNLGGLSNNLNNLGQFYNSFEYAELLDSKPYDRDAQKKIEEIIMLENIRDNLELAREVIPRTFFPTHMLYFKFNINNHEIIGSVDTGAMSTIISEKLAKQIGIFYLCNTSYSNLTKDENNSKILGVIHAAEIKIEKT